jgi:hypothetical protein
MKKRTALILFLSLLLGAAGVQGQETAPKPPADGRIPPIEDTVSWISAHFEKSAQTLIIPVSAEGNFSPEQRELYQSNGTPIPTIDTNITILTTHTYSVSFQDCSVTLTQKAVNDATLKAADGAAFMAANRDVVKQEQNVERDSTVVGPFDLSNLRLDKIVVEPPNTLHPSMMKAGPRLRIAATSAISNAVTTDGQDLQDAFGLGPIHEDHKTMLGDREALAMTPSKTPDTVSEITIDFATQEMADRQAKAWGAAIAACGGKSVPDKLF